MTFAYVPAVPEKVEDIFAAGQRRMVHNLNVLQNTSYSTLESLEIGVCTRKLDLLDGD